MHPATHQTLTKIMRLEFSGTTYLKMKMRKIGKLKIGELENPIYSNEKEFHQGKTGVER